MVRLFVDDVRNPPEDGSPWILARSYEQAIGLFLEHGIPDYISFDHDLGMGPTGYDLVKWMVEQHLEGLIKFPSNFTFKVHSANPVGAENITNYLNNFMKHEYNL